MVITKLNHSLKKMRTALNKKISSIGTTKRDYCDKPLIHQLKQFTTSFGLLFDIPIFDLFHVKSYIKNIFLALKF